METNRPSVTAEGAAIMRALHQKLPPDARVLNDPIASRLIDPDGQAYRARIAFLESFSPPIRSRLTNFVMRSRYAEDSLAEAVQQGTRQYIILGAGLDTFAFRQPDWAQSLRIFEADHPATQAWKRMRLKGAGIVPPGNLIFVAIDFDQVSLAEGLSKASFNCAAPAFFSLLGVSQYLSMEALRRTFAFVLGTPKSSEIVLSFVLPETELPSDEAALAEAFARRFATIGEPWLTRLAPEHLVSILSEMGFSSVVHLTPSEANSRYFQGRHDVLNASLMEQMIRAVV
jgi:methyltransferase (TIGR00027 family)